MIEIEVDDEVVKALSMWRLKDESLSDVIKNLLALINWLTIGDVE